VSFDPEYLYRKCMRLSDENDALKADLALLKQNDAATREIFSLREKVEAFEAEIKNAIVSFGYVPRTQGDPSSWFTDKQTHKGLVIRIRELKAGPKGYEDYEPW
jgi:hypothetical protein